MAASMRIVYNNLITAATVGGVAAPNVLNDYKSRTETGTSFVLTVPSTTGAVAITALLPEHVTAVTMTASYGAGPTTVSTTETTTSNFANAVGYGVGKYVTIYTTIATAVTSITLTFSTSVKVSRIIVGNYWEPKYNTTFGVQTGYEDTSSSERTQAGDLYTTNGPRHRTVTLELPYLDQTDKTNLYDIIRGAGKIRPLFLSVFPQDPDPQKEQAYSLYGKLSAMPALTYAMFSMYTSNLQFEEF